MCYLYLVFWRLTSSPYFLLLWCFSSLLLSSPDCKRNAVSTCQSINPSKSLIFDNMIWLTHNLSISLYTDSANCLNALAYMRLQKSKLSIFCCLNSHQSLMPTLRVASYRLIFNTAKDVNQSAIYWFLILLHNHITSFFINFPPFNVVLSALTISLLFMYFHELCLSLTYFTQTTLCSLLKCK